MDVKQDILDFKQSIMNFSLEELQAKKEELNNQLSKMILDSDVVIKIAIVDALIEAKEK